METKNNNKIKIKKLPYVSVENPATIKVFTNQNGIIEVESLKNKPFALNRFIKISKYEYIDKETGEIRKYKKTETRTQSPNELRKTFKNLRRTINSNFVGSDTEKHITLTFSAQSIDPKSVHTEFKRWWRTMKKLFSSLEYICILEPNSIEGNWHLHILVKSLNAESLDISQELLNKTWKNGFSKVTDIKNVTNIGAYFTSILTNINLTEDIQNDENTSKLILKGARLKYYKTGQKIFTTSRGIVRNKGHTVTQEEVEEITRGAKLLYADSKVISKIDSNGKEIILNTITYQNYEKAKE